LSLRSMTVKILILFALLIFCYGSTNFVEAQQSTINSESSFNYINEHHQRPNAQKNVHGGDRIDLRSNFNCDVAAKLFCPGATVACALCGLLDLGCGDSCIWVGFYCGISGFACMAEMWPA